ncbi:MAG: tRNA pseudouridine(38-40) synthase TruA [Pirellulales bacterium]
MPLSAAIPARRTLKLTLAYDGADFAGWQSQPELRTVQGTLKTALERIAAEPVNLMGSGRTDAGVHALGQVASFETTSQHSCEVFHRALNAELPEDIAVLAVEEAPAGFHALRSARRKRYRYVIHDSGARDVLARRFCWQLAYQLDDAAMKRAAEALVGTHDFSSFRTGGPKRRSSVRTVFALDIARPHADRPFELYLEVEADGFLYNMVRVIAGTLVQVGRGVETEHWVHEVLESQSRFAAGRTAPPQGLILLWVRYA